MKWVNQGFLLKRVDKDFVKNPKNFIVRREKGTKSRAPEGAPVLFLLTIIFFHDK